MNRRHFFLTLGLGAAALAATATLARKQSSGSRPPRIITTKTNAYLIGKIEPVLTGKIREVAPAPGGRYALITQDLRPEPTDDVKEPFGEQKLWLYDAFRRTSKLIHRVEDDPAKETYRTISQLSWFPGTKRALIVQWEMKHLLSDNPDIKSQFGIYDADRGTIRWLTGLPPTLLMVREMTGLSGFLLSGSTKETPKTQLYSVLQADGSYSPLAKRVFLEGIFSVRGISTDGKHLFLRTMTFEKVEERRVRKDTWETIEIAQGTVTPLSEAPKDKDMIAYVVEKPAPKLALTLSADPAKLTGQAGRSANTNALWLEASEPGPEKKFVRGLVTAEAQSDYLLPDLSAVLFTHDDALYAAPIVSLDRVAFEKLMKQLAISNAKQAGLGLLMYAQDYDENFPHDPASVKDAILPYIKNNDVLADFVYTYSGPTNLSKIEKPSDTPLGYIPSPGGRALIFADGHVKWEPMPEN
ncbi:hypothetical protein, partial [Armatimonas sp.]|uniref:hypothetical protein n=1 Tax=Armatimonas sp. TaxID=1872638 RepID=UPI003752E870